MTDKRPQLPEPGLSLCFRVEIDGHDFGSFTSCKGLSFEVDIEKVEEGGNNSYVHQLPGRVKFTNVTFTRALNRDSEKVARWFASMGGVIRRTTARITVTSSDPTDVIASWSLRDVIPVKWSGPELTAGNAQVATETFEIAHHGFTEG